MQDTEFWNVKKEIAKNDEEPKCRLKVIELLKSMLKIEPAERADSYKVLNHEYFLDRRLDAGVRNNTTVEERNQRIESMRRLITGKRVGRLDNKVEIIEIERDEEEMGVLKSFLGKLAGIGDDNTKWKVKWIIHLKGEVGVDEGGLLREVFVSAIRELCDSREKVNLGLFECPDKLKALPIVNSKLNAEKRKNLILVGKLLAKV